MAAHVRKQQEACARRHSLGLEIRHVDVIVGINIHQNSDAADIVDRPWHWCQRVGIGQDLVPRHHAACPQRQLDGIAAGGAGDTIVDTLPLGIFAFKPACLVAVAFGQIIAMQAAALHDFHGAFDRGGGYRFLLGEGFCELRTGCHPVPRAAYCAQSASEHTTGGAPVTMQKGAGCIRGPRQAFR